MKKIFLFIMVLFLVGCSTPIYTLGPHQNTNVMSGKWTFYGEQDKSDKGSSLPLTIQKANSRLDTLCFIVSAGLCGWGNL